MVRHLRFIREGRAIPQIIFSDDLHSDDPQCKARVQTILTGYLDRICEIVGEGQSQGVIRKEAHPATVALMFLGMIVPAGILWHLTEGDFDVTRHAERAWQMFRAAITVEGK